MSSLAHRTMAEEQMDSLDLPTREYKAILADLAQVNRWTLAARPTLAFLDRTIPRGGKMRLLDVGFGHGDMLRRIGKWAQRRGVTTQLVGIDLNPRSAPIARSATPDALGIHYITGDYRSLAGQHWDVIVSSLVAHHMSEEQLVSFLRFMEVESGKGWFVNDLHRHGLAYFAYPLLARIMRWHLIVRQDGTLSIARSYRPAEWRALLAQAGITHARVQRHFPFRLCVARTR